jgi:two-component system NtrC family sensor kinase
VGDLLTFSRTGKTETEPVDVNEAIESALSFVEGRAKTGNVEIAKEYGDNIPVMNAYRNQLQQVIVNLANNAMDAMPDGGRITISTTHREGRVELSIRDTGCGMNEEVKRHLFEPFFTTKEVGRGTGLGLSICYEIAKRHGGSIEVESAPGEGALFIVTLPSGGGQSEY